MVTLYQHERTGMRATVVGSWMRGEGREVVDLSILVRLAGGGFRLKLATVPRAIFDREWTAIDPNVRLFELALPIYLAHQAAPPAWQRAHARQHGHCGCNDCCDLRFFAARLGRVCAACGDPQDGADWIGGEPACVSCALRISIAALGGEGRAA